MKEELINKLSQIIKLNIKPNFVALGQKYKYDYRTAKNKYYEKQNKKRYFILK